MHALLIIILFSGIVSCGAHETAGGAPALPHCVSQTPEPRPQTLVPFMSLSVQFEVSDTASPALQKALEQLTPGEIAHATGQFLAEAWRDHVADLPDNKMGWPSTGFWEKAARSITWDNGNFGTALHGNQIGMRQRYYGGDIHPVDANKLTIPARAEAYGKTARDFNLRPLYRWANGRPEMFALVEADSQRVAFGHRKDGKASQGAVSGGLVMFWLVSSVHQEPDANVIPPIDVFSDVIEGHLKEVVS